MSLPVRKIETMRTVAAAVVDIIDALSLENKSRALSDVRREV